MNKNILMQKHKTISFIQKKYSVKLPHTNELIFITKYYNSIDSNNIAVEPKTSQALDSQLVENLKPAMPHKPTNPRVKIHKYPNGYVKEESSPSNIPNPEARVMVFERYRINNRLRYRFKMDQHKRNRNSALADNYDQPGCQLLGLMDGLRGDLVKKHWSQKDLLRCSLKSTQRQLKVLRNSGKLEEDQTEDSDNLTTVLKSIMDSIINFLASVNIRKTIRITSPIIAIITNIIVLIRKESGIITTTILAAFLGVHMVSLIDAILEAYGVSDIAIDFVQHHVTNMIDQYVTPVVKESKETAPIQRNSAIIATILGWLKPVLSVIFLTIGFFIPTVSIDEWCRTINTRMTTIDKLSAGTNDITNKFLEDICGLDLYGSKYIVETRKEIAEEGIKLTKIPTEDFIRDLKLRKELYAYTQKALEVMGEKLPNTGQDKLIKTIAPFNTIINSNIKILSEIIKTIEECIQLSSRPPTVGALLTGAPGVGKSKFSSYAMKAIADNLKLDSSIYSISKNGDYFDPYAGEHFGIHDEFLYTRSDDPIIPSLTKLLSGEYYNLEGAAIHNKKQTCELKMVSFTSNGQDPSKNLLVKINENAVQAIWDRIVRVEVKDDLITTRHDATGNKHRRPDFSHLNIRMTISTDKNPGKTAYVKITPAEYILYFSYRIAHNIINFSKDNDVTEIYDVAMLTSYTKENEKQFSNLSKKLLLAINEVDIDRIPSMSFTNIKANSDSRQFFTVRLEGRGGTGKTTTVHHIANKLRNIFSMEVLEVGEDFPHPKPHPAIYIVDDVLTTNNADKYLSWSNLTNKKSIIIIVTNIKFPEKYYWNLSKYTDLSGFSQSSGIARRIGIEGYYKHNADHGCVNPTNATQVRMEDVMIVNGIVYDTPKLTNLIYDKYIKFVATSRTITIVQDNHSIDDADITVAAKNFEEFSKAMSSKTMLVTGYFKPTPKFSVTLKSVDVLKDFSNLSTPEAFTISNITNANEFQSNVVTLIEKLCIYKPEAKVIINIKEDNISAGYVNRCLFINKDIFNISSIIKHNGEEVYIPRNGQLHTINLKDLAMLKATKVVSSSITELTATELDMIYKYIADQPILQNQLIHYTCSYQIDNETTMHMNDIRNKRPSIIKCIGLIVGISATVYAGISLYRYFTRKDDNDAMRNTAPEEDHAVTRKIQQKYQNEYSKGVEHKVIKQRLIDEYGEQEWREAEWAMRNGNGTAIDLIAEGDWIGLRNHWRLHPDDIPEISRNQITPDMITFQSSNQIENLANVLEVNTVILVNKDIQGKNFGLGICGPYLLSVAHAVHDNMNACFIINNGTQYPVECVQLDRKRDIAIFKIVNNKFAFRDIRSHFASPDLFDKTKEGYFIRPIHTSRTIAPCVIKYISKRARPITDGSPFFSPDTGLYMVMFATTDRPIFIKSGDCGLPLVVRTVDGLKITAIHNAVTQGNMAFFTSVSNIDFDIIDSIKSNATAFHFEKPGHAFNTHEWYQKILTDEKKTSNLPSCGLRVLGYHPEAKLHSHPKDSHRELLDKIVRDEIQERLPTKPSALIFKPKLMSDEKLIKDKKGVPHTLWTQSVKYTHREPLYTKWDPYVYNETMRMIHERITRDYGKPKYLNLAININGDGTTNNKPWDMTTSAGPLLKKLYNVHSKESLFVNKANDGSRPFYVFADNEAAKHTRDMYEMYTQGLEEGVPMSIWCKDNRKVELLPADKVHEGKVRLFNEMDLSVNMALKKYFGHMLTQILKNHIECPYKIGMDVYSEATIYHRHMDKIDGNLISTDISGCDKTMPKEIIYEFCRAFCQGYDDKLVTALADSLTYTVHIMDGTIYVVDNGNESGSYVTTMLNCFAMEVITMYPIIERLLETGIRPTLQVIDDLMIAIYYGDDRSVKISKELKITEEDLVRCGSYFNFKVTPAKVQSDYVSFCSREFIPDRDGVVFPRLKQTSVLSCLFWIKKKETKYIQANINVALFEASLHDKAFFSRVVNIVNTIMTNYPEVVPFVQVYEYEVYRKVFKMFIYNEAKSPVLLKTGETEESKDEELLQNFEQLQIKPNTHKIAKSIMDYVSFMNRQSQTTGKPVQYQYTSSGAKEAPKWDCTATFDNKSFEGTGKTKKAAQQSAVQKHFESMNVKRNNYVEPKLTINMQVYADWISNQEFFLPYSSKVGLATVEHNGEYKLSVNLDPDTPLAQIEEALAIEGYYIYSKRDIYYFIGETREQRIQLLIDELMYYRNSTKERGDQPIEPAMMNQAVMAEQRSMLPHQTNPQPTAIMPAMTHSGEDIVGSISTTLPETLMPVGAPDMLSVGAIDFDIKQYIYTQYVDCNQEFIISDDTVSGSIVAQIPYGLHSQFISPEIKKYAELHERFTGSLLFRITVMGNPLFSGGVGIAWFPRKIKKTTYPVSELMKYAYQVEGVTASWNKIHVLHDARREHFYRLVKDEDTDYDNRPHLVIFLYMTLQNPMKEGVQVRMRIASKLANAGESNPFMFSNPSVYTDALTLADTVPGLTTVQGSNVPNVFPHVLNIDSSIFTDGNMAAPQVFDFGIPHRNLILNNALNGARMHRLGSNNDPLGSFFQFDREQTYPLYPTSNSNAGIATIYTVTNIPRAQYNIFANGLGAVKEHRLTSQPPVTYKGQDPDVFRNTLVEFINELNTKYITNKFGVTGLYYATGNDEGPFRFGLFKIITTHGVLILSIQLLDFSPDINTTAPDYVDQWGVLNYTQIDLPININTVASALPTDYQILRISDQPVSALIKNTLTNPTATDDPSISMYYKRLSQDVPVAQCYQFEIQDPVSFRTIATVRYLQEFGIFVIRGQDLYSFLPQKFSKLVLTNPALVTRTSGFPSTDTSLWLERTASTYVMSKQMEGVEHNMSKLYVTPNASFIAGGMLSGLGSGLSQKGKNKHELNMQQNQHNHESAMQESDQNYGLKYQKRGFAGAVGLAGVNYLSNSSLSKQDYTQKQQLAAQQNQFQVDQDRRNMQMAGARAPVSGATTAVSHA